MTNAPTGQGNAPDRSKTPKPNDQPDPHEPSNVRQPGKPTPDDPPEPHEARRREDMETQGE